MPKRTKRFCTSERNCYDQRRFKRAKGNDTNAIATEQPKRNQQVQCDECQSIFTETLQSQDFLHIANKFWNRITIPWVTGHCCNSVTRETTTRSNANRAHPELPSAAILCSSCTKFQSSVQEPFCRRSIRQNNLETGKNR